MNRSDTVPMQRQKPSEAIKWLYALCKERSTQLREIGYTAELAFWADFASVATAAWRGDAEDEVKLSEVLRLYLTVYCENCSPDMPAQEEEPFLERLRKNYDAIRQIVLESEDIDDSPRKLSSLLYHCSEESGLPASIQAALYVLKLVNASFETPLPFRLVEDA